MITLTVDRGMHRFTIEPTGMILSTCGHLGGMDRIAPTDWQDRPIRQAPRCLACLEIHDLPRDFVRLAAKRQRRTRELRDAARLDIILREQGDAPRAGESPLDRAMPDGQKVDGDTRAIIEHLTGHRFTPPTRNVAAYARAALRRWAIRH